MKMLFAGLTLFAAMGAVSPASAATFFRAELDGSQVVPSTPSEATGFATFTLNEAENQLEYFIKLSGLTLKPEASDRVESQDVNKIHLHVAPVGVNGPHVLNIFGLPSEDDDDLIVDYGAGTLSGIWTDSDATDLNGDGLFTAPNETKPLTGFIDDLKAGKLYVQVHTNEFDTPTGFPGELRGQITPLSNVSVPEPGTVIGLSVVAGAGVLLRRKISQTE